MPLPIAHSFAGYLIARFMHSAESARPAPGVLVGSLVVAANAPDFDFLPGLLVGDPGRFHHGVSHSLVAAAAFALVSALVARWLGASSPFRIGLLMGLGYSSHLLLDMLESWMDAHSGVVLMWPVLTERLSSPFPVFFGIRFDPEAGGFIRGLWNAHNVLAAGWEIVVVGGIWGLISMRSRRLR